MSTLIQARPRFVVPGQIVDGNSTLIPTCDVTTATTRRLELPVRQPRIPVGENAEDLMGVLFSLKAALLTDHRRSHRLRRPPAYQSARIQTKKMGRTLTSRWTSLWTRLTRPPPWLYQPLATIRSVGLAIIPTPTLRGHIKHAMRTLIHNLTFAPCRLTRNPHHRPRHLHLHSHNTARLRMSALSRLCMIAPRCTRSHPRGVISSGKPSHLRSEELQLNLDYDISGLSRQGSAAHIYLTSPFR